jgi:hypothetical protein
VARGWSPRGERTPREPSKERPWEPKANSSSKKPKVRARLTETFEELRAAMTPDKLVDQLTDYAREDPAADFFRNLAREIRENPLPLMLIGAGVAWLIIASSRSSRARAKHSTVREVGEIHTRTSAEVSASSEDAHRPASFYASAGRRLGVGPSVNEEARQRARRQDGCAMEQEHQ